MTPEQTDAIQHLDRMRRMRQEQRDFEERQRMAEMQRHWQREYNKYLAMRNLFKNPLVDPDLVMDKGL